MRGRRWAIAIVACAVLAKAPAADTHPGHGAVQVAVGQFKYAPAGASIYAGDYVLWSWDGPDTNHSVTADAGQAMDFDSDGGKPAGQVNHPLGDGYGISFPTAGTFHYHCKVHTFMKGTITVQPAPGGTATPPAAAPQLTKVTVKPRRFCSRCRKPGITVGFSVDGPVSMRAALRRHGRVVKEIDFQTPPGAYSKRLKFKNVRNGKYVLRLVAIDDASGKSSTPADRSVEVRG
jgi:plastocyanin